MAQKRVRYAFIYAEADGVSVAGVMLLLTIGTALLVLIVGQNLIDIFQKVGHSDRGEDLADNVFSVLRRLLEM